VVLQRVQAVKVERGPNFIGNGSNGESLAVKLIPSILKVMHPSSPWNNFDFIT
jgi:hypothetical protein